MSRPLVLLLGGTRDAYILAEHLIALSAVESSAPNPLNSLSVLTSLAGRTAHPRQPAGDVRVGGFGGVPGLAAFLTEHAVSAVIDATHPYAGTMGWNAFRACQQTGCPLLRLERPAWTASTDRSWTSVDDWAEALRHIRAHGLQRIFLALGRQDLTAFANQDDLTFVIRCVDPPDISEETFPNATVLLQRGPFTEAGDRALFGQHGIQAVACRNAGGSAGQAKLTASADLGLPIFMLRRPDRPPCTLVTTTDQAVGWLKQTLALSGTGHSGTKTP